MASIRLHVKELEEWMIRLGVGYAESAEEQS
jgi:hypothetical protein